MLLPSALSLLPFGVIVATVIATAVVTVVHVDPATAAFAAFVFTLTVVATTFLAFDVTLVFDCCVPLPPEEDHRFPPPLGKAPSWPSSPSFIDCCRRRRAMPPLPGHGFASAASWSHSLFTCFPPLTYRGITSPVRKKQEMYFFIFGTTFMKSGPDSQIWRIQIWNDRSQKQNKNGRHPLLIVA